jgi:hypothetical protein
MITFKALILALPVALAGGWMLRVSTGRIEALRADLVRLDSEGRVEGESFLRTLQGSHAERQLDILSRRRIAAIALAAARRDRLLGGMVVAFAALLFVFLRAAQRIAGELAEDSHLVDPPPAPPS